MMYPTKSWTDSEVHAPPEKPSSASSNVWQKSWDQLTDPLGTDVYIRRLWMKIELMISVGEIQGAAGIWSSLRSPLVRPVGRFRNREDARTLQSQHRQRLLVFLQVGHRTSTAGNFVRLAEFHFSNYNMHVQELQLEMHYAR